MNILLNQLIIRNENNLLEDIFENFFLTIIFFTLWSKDLIGGGDLKVLFIFLLYIPSESYFSLIFISNNILSDRFEFFLFLLLLIILKKFSKNPKFFSKNEEYENQISKPIPLSPYFLLSSVLMVLF